ncbi:STAS domain-containing protein [Xylophilus ampelinus]|uniref:STAS domain-containing protein n=1 Tax=Xylophilus ampelinus TaxID=54067 RepID=A0A318SKD1_9BURK|nr:STAS domain-containing protein [Xylophilus ampelinus]MCS4509634.1 STAS domain-containing protein [Xylophilus ampelinus]PYE78881.1 STAS domain-containing protein [Xylophilus ampelinus]
MAKNETPGFLSRVVRFVRRPDAAWADDDVPGDEADSGYSKQLLKEVVERRRRDDTVRKREFDQLRRLRRRGAGVDTGGEGAVSFFATSLLSRPDDRAVTLRKIDEIEEQMSQQWWTTRPAEPGELPVRVVPAGGPPLYAHRARASASGGAARGGPDTGAPVSGDLQVDIELPDAGHDLPEAPPLMAELELQSTVEDLPGFVHDPQLEESAIRFANADYSGAEAALRLLAAEDGGASESAWGALFDLYRCIGQQERFESAALEFAQRFGRSPPSWYWVCPPGTATHSLEQDDFRWHCAAQVDGAAVKALEDSLVDAPAPWLLDWSALEGFHDDVVLPLLAAFTRWGDLRIPIRLAGVESLLQALQARTPSADALVDPIWWRLHMEVLRVLGQPDAFEMVALDYCVTYEVSPPSWQPARCECRTVSGSAAEDDSTLGPDLSAAAAGATVPPPDARGAGFGSHFPVLTQTLLPPAPVAELAGEITGDPDAAIARLDAAAEHGADTVIVSCDRLVRMDFSAAGSVLNWAAAQAAAGRKVQFRNLHRLAATFLNVIGVDEYARVHARKD